MACIFTIMIGMVAIGITAINGYYVSQKIADSTIVYNEEEKKWQEQEAVEVLSYMDTEEKKEELKQNEVDGNTSESLKLCLLGEIMMGGEVGQKVDDSYTSVFKNIYSKTKAADFTYANFSTNITKLDRIEEVRSDYLVTKKALSALKVLGLDCVSIASDHMVDYPSEILKNTIDELEEENIWVAGRENMPVYLQKGEQRIAIVASNSIINGTKSLYQKVGISLYEQENFVKNIKEAKEAADVVIVDMHWGRENRYEITDQMRQIATLAIDSGADLVIGSHALGVYPIEQYKGVPILYSLGYLIGDKEVSFAQNSFLFDVSISKENKIEEITMTPILIQDKKEVLLYEDYDMEKAKEILETYQKKQMELGLCSRVEGNTIKILLRD